ncbi:hypothetical protein Efla_004877 [Eimeria flavescens]
MPSFESWPDMHSISTCLCPKGAPSNHSPSRNEHDESDVSGHRQHAPHMGVACYEEAPGGSATFEPPFSCCGGAHQKSVTSRSTRTCGSAPPAAGSKGESAVFDRPGRHHSKPMDGSALAKVADDGQWKFKREGFILSFAGPLTDSYDVEPRKLGQGTYGSVCRAVNKSTKTVRAVKTISKSKVRNVKRFKQEISIMKSLDHPNIMSVPQFSAYCPASGELKWLAFCPLWQRLRRFGKRNSVLIFTRTMSLKLFETFEDHKNVYLVMELCRGGELFDRIIEQGYFSEAYACSLMRCILAALFYLHKHGIVHRDLKPENFMFLDKGKDAPFKIIDFGLATRFSNNAYMSTRAGTPFYVAPQVLQGKYTYKCDMWSAGVIMYILLCGYPPFHGENDAEILARVKVGRFSFNEQDWKGVSSEAKDLVRKLMAFDPHQRLSAEQALNHPWIKHFSTPPNPATDASFSRTMLDKFRAFQALCKLKKAALTIIAQQMNESQIELLTHTFLALDEDGDGSITLHELRTGLKKAGIKDIPSDLEQLMKDVDSDGSGVIDYTEFVAATLDKRQYIQANVCWAAFRVFDLDGNGRISAQDLAHVLLNTDVQMVFPSPASLNTGSVPPVYSSVVDGTNQEGQHGSNGNLSHQQKQLQMQQVKSIIREVDKNGDGEIDFDEFMDMMRRSTMYMLALHKRSHSELFLNSKSELR